MNDLISSLGNCPRCKGRGIIGQFSHVNQGVCFRCNGTRSVVLSLREEIITTFSAIKAAEYAELKSESHAELLAELLEEARAANHEELLKEFFPGLNRADIITDAGHNTKK